MAIITLGDCRRLPQATDCSDTDLSAAIVTAESLADQVCKQTLALTTYSETRDIGRDQDELVLRAVPVVIDQTHALTVTDGGTTLVKDTDFALDDASGVLVRIGGATFAEGRRQLAVTYSAGYTAATAPAALKEALIELVGWRIGNIANRGATQENMDGYSVQYEQLVDGVPASIAAMLAPWTRRCLG